MTTHKRPREKQPCVAASHGLDLGLGKEEKKAIPEWSTRHALASLLQTVGGGQLTLTDLEKVLPAERKAWLQTYNISVLTRPLFEAFWQDISDRLFLTVMHRLNLTLSHLLQIPADSQDQWLLDHDIPAMAEPAFRKLWDNECHLQAKKPRIGAGPESRPEPRPRTRPCPRPRPDFFLSLNDVLLHVASFMTWSDRHAMTLVNKPHNQLRWFPFPPIHEAVDVALQAIDMAIGTHGSSAAADALQQLQTARTKLATTSLIARPMLEAPKLSMVGTLAQSASVFGYYTSMLRAVSYIINRPLQPCLSACDLSGEIPQWIPSRAVLNNIQRVHVAQIMRLCLAQVDTIHEFLPLGVEGATWEDARLLIPVYGSGGDSSSRSSAPASTSSKPGRGLDDDDDDDGDAKMKVVAVNTTFWGPRIASGLTVQTPRELRSGHPHLRKLDLWGAFFSDLDRHPRPISTEWMAHRRTHYQRTLQLLRGLHAPALQWLRLPPYLLVFSEPIYEGDEGSVDLATKAGRVLDFRGLVRVLVDSLAHLEHLDMGQYHEDMENLCPEEVGLLTELVRSSTNLKEFCCRGTFDSYLKRELHDFGFADRHTVTDDDALHTPLPATDPRRKRKVSSVAFATSGIGPHLGQVFVSEHLLWREWIHALTTRDTGFVELLLPSYHEGTWQVLSRATAVSMKVTDETVLQQLHPEVDRLDYTGKCRVFEHLCSWAILQRHASTLVSFSGRWFPQWQWPRSLLTLPTPTPSPTSLALQKLSVRFWEDWRLCWWFSQRQPIPTTLLSNLRQLHAKMLSVTTTGPLLDGLPLLEQLSVDIFEVKYDSKTPGGSGGGSLRTVRFLRDAIYKLQSCVNLERLDIGRLLITKYGDLHLHQTTWFMHHVVALEALVRSAPRLTHLCLWSMEHLFPDSAERSEMPADLVEYLWLLLGRLRHLEFLRVSRLPLPRCTGAVPEQMFEIARQVAFTMHLAALEGEARHVTKTKAKAKARPADTSDVDDNDSDVEMDLPKFLDPLRPSTFGRVFQRDTPSTTTTTTTTTTKKKRSSRMPGRKGPSKAAAAASAESADAKWWTESPSWPIPDDWDKWSSGERDAWAAFLRKFDHDPAVFLCALQVMWIPPQDDWVAGDANRAQSLLQTRSQARATDKTYKPLPHLRILKWSSPYYLDTNHASYAVEEYMYSHWLNLLGYWCGPLLGEVRLRHGNTNNGKLLRVVELINRYRRECCRAANGKPVDGKDEKKHTPRPVAVAGVELRLTYEDRYNEAMVHHVQDVFVEDKISLLVDCVPATFLGEIRRQILEREHREALAVHSPLSG